MTKYKIVSDEDGSKAKQVPDNNEDNDGTAAAFGDKVCGSRIHYEEGSRPSIFGSVGSQIPGRGKENGGEEDNYKSFLEYPELLVGPLMSFVNGGIDGFILRDVWDREHANGKKTPAYVIGEFAAGRLNPLSYIQAGYHVYRMLDTDSPVKKFVLKTGAKVAKKAAKKTFETGVRRIIPHSDEEEGSKAIRVKISGGDEVLRTPDRSKSGTRIKIN